MGKARENQKESLIAIIHQLEQSHKASSGNRPLLHQLIIKREELRDLLEKEAYKVRNKFLKERYQRGNKVGKHLAAIVRKKKEENFIEKIKNKNGDLRYTSKEIDEEFRQYFRTLYSVGQREQYGQEMEEKARNFLEEAGLPKLSDDTKELERLITVEEVGLTLRSSPPGKSPGPDSFNSSFYKKCKDSLLPRLCKVWNGLGKQGEMCREALTASVTLIPKEGKDCTLCSSFRPIALLNADTKLYAKVLALRLKGLMSNLVHPNQVGFIPGREGRDNGVRSLLIIEAIRAKGSPGLLLSIDAEKAFDRVDWGFMFKTLAVLGIGPLC